MFYSVQSHHHSDLPQNGNHATTSGTGGEPPLPPGKGYDLPADERDFVFPGSSSPRSSSPEPQPLKQGKPLSAKTRQAISTTLTGRKYSEAHRQAISAGKTGKKRPDLSRIQKGKTISATHKQAISDAKKGKKHSDAHKQAISAGMMRRKYGQCKMRDNVSSAQVQETAPATSSQPPSGFLLDQGLAGLSIESYDVQSMSFGPANQSHSANNVVGHFMAHESFPPETLPSQIEDMIGTMDHMASTSRNPQRAGQMPASFPYAYERQQPLALPHSNLLDASMQEAPDPLRPMTPDQADSQVVPGHYWDWASKQYLPVTPPDAWSGRRPGLWKDAD